MLSKDGMVIICLWPLFKIVISSIDVCLYASPPSVQVKIQNRSFAKVLCQNGSYDLECLSFCSVEILSKRLKNTEIRLSTFCLKLPEAMSYIRLCLVEFFSKCLKIYDFKHSMSVWLCSAYVSKIIKGTIGKVDVCLSVQKRHGISHVCLFLLAQKQGKTILCFSVRFPSFLKTRVEVSICSTPKSPAARLNVCFCSRKNLV